MKRIYDYDAILADLRRRISQQAIAKKRGVSAQLVSKIAVANGLGKEANADPDGLPPGDWVLCRRTRVQVWRVA